MSTNREIKRRVSLAAARCIVLCRPESGYAVGCKFAMESYADSTRTTCAILGRSTRMCNIYKEKLKTGVTEADNESAFISDIGGVLK